LASWLDRIACFTAVRVAIRPSAEGLGDLAMQTISFIPAIDTLKHRMDRKHARM
jgi:hypothetical protein